MIIAHVITRLLLAGSEENTIASCLAQARSGHEVLLIHGNEWHPTQLANCGRDVKLIEIRDLVHEVNPRKDIRATRALRSLFLKTRPNVVHTHQSKAGIIGRCAARLANVPVIVHGVHILPFTGTGLAKKMMYLTAERGVARFTNAFVNVSEGTRQTCLDHAVGRPEQHFVAHSGFDIDRFRNAPWPDDWRAMLGVPPNESKPPVVLMLAALEPRKRHVEFLEVFQRITARNPDVRLLLAGEGSTRPAVEQAIDTLKLGANVRLIGFHAHPEQLISLADLTVLTSLREGLPRVTVQSLAGGKPVITTVLPGIEEVVQHGVNGLITPGDDLRVTADAVADLLASPTRLERMQAAAARTDVSTWRVDSMCATLADIYDRFVPSEAPMPAAELR